MFIQFSSVKLSPTTLYRLLIILKLQQFLIIFHLFCNVILFGLKGFTQDFPCTEKQPFTGILQTSHAKKFRKFHRPAILEKF